MIGIYLKNLLKFHHRLIGSAESVKGNTERGAAKFQTVCASCHGFDGIA